MKKPRRLRGETNSQRTDASKVDRPVAGKRQQPAPRFLVRLVGSSRADILFSGDSLYPVRD